MFGLHSTFSENIIIPSEPTGESLLSFGASDGISRNPVVFLIIFALASFAFMSILGMSMGMETKDGRMSGCPFMAVQATMCQMSVTEHIAKWQQAFLGIPAKTNFLALAAALLIASLISFTKLFSQLKKLIESAARLSAYHKATLVKVFDPLLTAFSDGILNPRIYEPAHI